MPIGTPHAYIGTKDTPSEDTPKQETPNGAVGGVFKLWEQNMPGTLSPVLIDQIHAMIEETSAESVIEGIKVAVANGVRKPSYVRGVAVRHASGEGKPTSMQNAKGGSWSAMKTDLEY